MIMTPDRSTLSPVSSATPSPTLDVPSRPMLAREADAMYWMSRYVERAEHVARLLLVNTNLLMDVGDLAPKLEERQWQSILTILHLPDLSKGDEPIAPRIAQHLTFNPENPNSLVSCLTRARENARSIRESISAEMWENLNTLYWSLRGDEGLQRFEESPDALYRSVMTASSLFQGLTDQTLAHDQRWQFTQLAKYLERIDVTCRVIETKFNVLGASDATTETAIRNIHWMAVLRSCCSIEAYRRNFPGDLDPMKVAAFLILEKRFPRSIRYSVCSAHAAIAAIRSGVNLNSTDAAERVLGRLDAQLEYAEVGEILSDGLPVYLQRIQSAIADAAIAVQKAYFLH